MKFIKEEHEERGDYIFQKDNTTKNGMRIVIITLVVLVGAVIVSGIHFEWF
ncbi:hypothetical protein [Winogradskyella endarachnes]|uniref:hypothetical protein n=1 Tax=Winogradskyella endarachnes TaxID=2681965 RepID=UPI0018D221F1|nr:hypothetical protein [Winogradskyella endarachnes]